jgi:WD40 repeat protein
VEITRNPVVTAVSLCAALLCAWIVFIGSKSPPVDRRASNVALSASGRWLAAGTARGEITVWDETRPDVPQRVAFPRGSLNDLHFSPDEHVLAIASEDLGIYDLTKSTAPRLLRSDHGHYGSVRFSQDGRTLLVITAASLIETIDKPSGASRLKICCDSYYGEVVFTPDGQTIANAGHWPRLWDARSGRLVAALAANREIATLRPIAFDTSRGTISDGISRRLRIRLGSENKTADRRFTTTTCLRRYHSRFGERMDNLCRIRQRRATLEPRHRSASACASSTLYQQSGPWPGWHFDHLRNCRRQHRVVGRYNRTTPSINEDSGAVTAAT